MPAFCSNCQASLNPNDSTIPDCVFDERCDPCTTLACLNAKILETEELLEGLTRQRNIARTEMNRVHDPLIQQVPPEIASHIFTLHIYNDYTDMAEYPRPLVLASVCKKWREIVFSTPQIWASLVVYDHDVWDFPAHLVEQWLARSGQLPLDIKILWEDPPDEPDVSAMETLIEAICSYSNRWNTLELDIPSKAFIFFKADTLVHQHLERLEIDCSRSELPSETPFDPINVIIHPEEIELCCMPPSLVRVDWKNVVDLSLLDSTPKEILYTLRQCRRIRELSASIAEWDEITTLTTPLTLPYLKSLRYASYSDTTLFLDLLTLPALSNLFHGRICGQADLMSLASMLKRSACLLVKLDLEWIQRESLDEDDLTNLLLDLPSLRTLQLIFPESFEDSTFLDQFLMDPAMSPSRPFLPRLESFSYNGPRCFSWHTLATVYYIHSRSLPAAKSDQDVQQPLHPELPPRPLKSLSVTTRNSERNEDFIDRESLLLFFDLPKKSMEVKLDTKLVEKSIEYHGLSIGEDVSSFYSLTV